MGIAWRHYVLQEDGELRRVSRRLARDLPMGADALPDYAGTKQKVIEVLVESDGNKPVRILDIVGVFWDFDAEGYMDESFIRVMGEWMEFAFSHSKAKREGRVVDLVPELKKKELQERHRWLPTQEDVDRVAADLWPGINGPVADVKAIRGKQPRKPPLTYDAKRALDEIGVSVSGIDYQMGKLSEAGLKGLSFEAARHGSFEDQALWQGIADYAKHRQAILAAHRTGKGEWYAVVRAFRAESAHRDRIVAMAHAKGRNRLEAIEEGRRLMVAKAAWLGQDTRIDVTLYSALEWQPEED